MTTDPNPDRPEVDDPRVLALAKARQQMAHKNPFNFVCPPWDGLTEQEQHLSLLDARNYLRAALDAGLVPAAALSAPTDRSGLRDRIAEAVVPLLLDTLPKVIARARGYELADAVLAVLPADSEPHRLALSAALGLGTGAPWDAIRERAAELAGQGVTEGRNAVFAGVRPQTLTAIASHLDARAVAILRPDSETYGEWQAVVAELRRLAAETPRPETQAEAYPPETYWQIETQWRSGDWRSWALRTERDDALAEFERAKDSKSAWRLVRFHTTTAVEAEYQPATEPQDAPPVEPHPTEADLRHALAVAAKFHGQSATPPAVVAEPGKESDAL